MFDRPPSRFIAIASVSCASRDSEPSDIAPVTKRLTISAAGSTSSSGIPPSSGNRKAISPRIVRRRALSALTVCAYCSYVSKPPSRTACWSSAIVSGFHWWNSPSRLQANNPTTGSSSSAVPGYARAWRASISSASVSIPIPPIRDGVPVK